MKSTKTKRYVVEKKFRERYTKIQLRSSSQRSTKLPFESGTSRAISAVAILLCLSFLVSLVLQYWSVRSCNRKGLQETKQQLLFHSNQDQLSSNLCVGVCVGGVSAPLTVSTTLCLHSHQILATERPSNWSSALLKDGYLNLLLQSKNVVKRG